MDTFLGIDLGTSGCRCAVFDQRLNMLSCSSTEYPLITLSSSEIEQDAILWWESVRRACKRAVLDAGEAGAAVKSLSISSQSISIVPVSRQGAPLRNAISWLDTRAKRQADALVELYGFQKLFQITGKRANSMYSLPKLLWLRQNEPDIYRNAARILFPLDFLHTMLCGEAVTDHTVAGGSMLYDLHSQGWSRRLTEDCGIDVGKLPEIAWSGTPIGTVRPEVAQELGLGGQVLVVVGGQDQKCAALGAGISEKSSVLSLGTAGVVAQLSAQPILDTGARIPSFSFLLPGRWVLEGIVSAAGPSYSWFRRTFAPDKGYAELDLLADRSPRTPSKVFFFPYFAGESSPHWLSQASGTFTGISLTTDLGQMARSVLEGIACEIRSNLAVMREIHRPAEELRAFGGGTKGPVFCQIIADVIQKPVVTFRSPEAALAGAAMLAARGAGVPVPDSLPVQRVYEPNPRMIPYYEDYYAAYESARKRIFAES